MQAFTQFVQQLFAERKQTFSPSVEKIRTDAFNIFCQKELPSSKNENWRHFPLDKSVDGNYQVQNNPRSYVPLDDIFRCNFKNIDSQMFTLFNGWYLHNNMPLTKYNNGVIIGSLAAAMEEYPDLVFPYFAKTNLEKCNATIALNEALFTDGIFIYVPDNVTVTKPIQCVSLVENNQDIFIQNRNLVVLGKNAELSFIHCDDSLKEEKSFINNVMELHIGEDARFNYFKLENKSEKSILINNLFANQCRNSQFVSHIITFNSGFTQNSLNVNLNEPYASANLLGLYMVDKNQFADNQIFISHNAPHTFSKQLYKGIADDAAQANFKGHILVKQDSQNIEAYQVNNNIALTDEAKIITRPFLEIYADDVKCSHGATIGQLDEEAMFYLQSRGICQRNARALLMVAFATEVIHNISIKELRERLETMIQMRLSGKFSACDQCILHCCQGLKSFSINPE